MATLLGSDKSLVRTLRIADTDATLASGPYPELERSVAALALRRDRAHVLLVADDEHPDELLADVLDETTAAAWLRSDEEPGL